MENGKDKKTIFDYDKMIDNNSEFVRSPKGLCYVEIFNWKKPVEEKTVGNSTYIIYNCKYYVFNSKTKNDITQMSYNKHKIEIPIKTCVKKLVHLLRHEDNEDSVILKIHKKGLKNYIIEKITDDELTEELLKFAKKKKKEESKDDVRKEQKRKGVIEVD